MLAESPAAACRGVCGVAGVIVAGGGPIFACPVKSSLLKESTSRDPRPAAPDGMNGGAFSVSFVPSSISCSVLLNGFGGGRIKGAWGGRLSSEISDTVVPNGSSGPSSSDELLSLLVSSSLGSGSGSVSGDDGGGDCTRTFFTGFVLCCTTGGSCGCGRVGAGKLLAGVCRSSGLSGSKTDVVMGGRFAASVAAVDVFAFAFALPAPFLRNGLFDPKVVSADILEKFER
jgi:hypothetical protein